MVDGPAKVAVNDTSGMLVESDIVSWVERTIDIDNVEQLHFVKQKFKTLNGLVMQLAAGILGSAKRLTGHMRTKKSKVGRQERKSASTVEKIELNKLKAAAKEGAERVKQAERAASTIFQIDFNKFADYGIQDMNKVVEGTAEALRAQW